MKKLLTLIAAATMAFSFTVAHAADDAKTKQQNKMTTCSADFKATGKDGKERQAFMKECLSASKQEKQQDKMSSCSADFKATGKDGKERQAFMKDCLSAKPTAAKPAAPAPGTVVMAPAAAPKK
jgi:outer membrane lipoprotein-sorting protein